MRHEQIGSREAFFLLFAVLSAKVFLSTPRYIAEDAQTAAWLLIVLAALWAALGWAIMVAFLRRFPGLSLIEAVEQTLGPYLALPVQLVYTGLFVYVTVVALRQFAETVLSAILPITPISVISVTLLGASAYACYLGLESVTRTARFFVPVVVFLVTSLLLLAIPSGARADQLLPLLGPGPVALLWRSLQRSSLFIEVLLLGVLVPNLKEPEKMPRVGYQAIFASALFWLAVEVVFQMLFPYPAGAKNPFPLLAVARLIAIGRFLQRVESFFIFAWIFAAAIKLSGMLYGAISSYAQLLHLKSYRPLTAPFLVLVLALSFLPSNLIEATQWDRGALRVWGAVPAFAPPLLLLGIAAIRGKGGRERARHKG